MSERSPKQAFMDEWSRISSPVKGDKVLRQIGKCVAHITDGGDKYADKPDTVYLSEIISPLQKRGFGTQAMLDILALADKFNVRINLHANQSRPSSPPDKKLREYYARFGFETAADQDNSWLHKMTRAPGAVIDHAALKPKI